MDNLDMQTQYTLAFRLRVKIAEMKTVLQGEGHDWDNLPSGWSCRKSAFVEALKIVEKP